LLAAFTSKKTITVCVEKDVFVVKAFPKDAPACMHTNYEMSLIFIVIFIMYAKNPPPLKSRNLGS